MATKEVETISGWINRNSSFFLSLGAHKAYWGETVGEKRYYQTLQELVSPLDGSEPTFGLLSLVDDGEGLGYGLMQIVKTKLNLSLKLILVAIDTYDTGGEIICFDKGDTNYADPSDPKNGEEFGLMYDSGYFGEAGWHMRNFKMGGSFPPVIFNSLGVQRGPSSDYIDIFTKTGQAFSMTGTIFVNVGREGGNLEVVSINGSTIETHLPVYVEGTSADWRISSSEGCESCELPPHIYDEEYEEYRKRHLWNEIELEGGGGRLDLSEIFMDQ